MFSHLRLVSPFLAGLVLAACGQPDPTGQTVVPTRVTTVAAAPSAGYEAVSSYTGRVEAALSSRVGFEIGGLLAGVTVEEGDAIRRGAVLAELDVARLDARRAEAAAALSQVRAELALARATLTRTRDAFDYKGVSRQQLDEAQQGLSALEAAEALAAARLGSIEVDLDKAKLTAPFDGVVVRRHADPGQVMAAGQAVLEIQSGGAPEVRIGVAPAAAAGLEIGRRYVVEVNTNPVAATLRTVVPRRDERTRTVDAIFVLDAGEQPVPPGDPVRPGDLARFETESWIAADGFWVPMTALVEGPRGLWQVLVAESGYGEPVGSEHHRLSNRTLEILYADETRAFVRGTLTDGDLVVSDGLHRVVVGQRVLVGSPDEPQRVAASQAETR